MSVIKLNQYYRAVSSSELHSAFRALLLPLLLATAAKELFADLRVVHLVDGALEERALALIDPEVRPLALLHLCLQLARAHHHGHPDLFAERGLDLLIAVAGLGTGLLEDDLLRG